MAVVWRLQTVMLFVGVTILFLISQNSNNFKCFCTKDTAVVDVPKTRRSTDEFSDLRSAQVIDPLSTDQGNIAESLETTAAPSTDEEEPEEPYSATEGWPRGECYARIPWETSWGPHCDSAKCQEECGYDSSSFDQCDLDGESCVCTPRCHPYPYTKFPKATCNLDTLKTACEEGGNTSDDDFCYPEKKRGCCKPTWSDDEEP